MITIYQKTPGALYPQPGRSVSTFATGLVRVDQKYICATVDAATHRAALAIGNPMPDGNSAPCIDGIFISPIPNEVDRGDGFTEFIVSAYGRSSITAAGIKITQRANSMRDPGITGSGAFQPYITYKVFEATGTACVMDDSELTYDDFGLAPDFLLPFNICYDNSGATATSRYTLKSLAIGTRGNYPQIKTVYFPRKGDTIRTDVIQGATPMQGYDVVFEREGYPDIVTSFAVLDPQIKIDSRTLFGKFSEVTFTLTRGPSRTLA